MFCDFPAQLVHGSCLTEQAAAVKIKSEGKLCDFFSRNESAVPITALVSLVSFYCYHNLAIFWTND